MIKTENLTILFVDIAGFTVTTSRQSRIENARLLQTFGSTLLPLIKGYKGRLIKTIGDALLITFRSPTDAMLCSMALQDAMHAHNLSAQEGDKIHIRVAANLGEVRVTKNDIFGEPVNVASRIEGVAPADEIYLSEAVYMAMNKAEVPAKEVGTRELAGVAQPVRLYNIPRFSTHRLVPEDVNSDEKGSELLYPYGGMHCQARSKGISCLFHLPNKKRLTHFLVPLAAVCIVALGAVLGYRHFTKPTSVPSLISQPAGDETSATGAEEIQIPDRADEPAMVKTEAVIAAPADKGEAASKDSSEKDAQRSTPSSENAAKTTIGTPAPRPEAVKEEHATRAWVSETKAVKEELSSGTWTPAPDEVEEGYATGTLSPETKTVEEERSSGTWTPEPDEVEKATVNISSQETDIAQNDLTGWDMTSAKKAYRAEEITRTEYNNIVRSLKARYENRIRELKEQLNAGKITRAEYDEEVRKAKLDLSGR